MIPVRFDYAAFDSIEESVRQLKENENAKVIAGGQSMLTNMKLKPLAASMLIDLRRISALRGLTWTEKNGLQIGAMTTYDEIVASQEIQGQYSALAEAVTLIGDHQVRNRGTIGGSLANNDSAADLPAVVLAFEVKINAVGSNGVKREIPVEDFFKGPFKTALASDEIITSVIFPACSDAVGSAYEKVKNPASGFAICAIAALVELSSNKTVNKCRIAVTGAAESAKRLKKVEAVLEGKEPTLDNIAAAASNVNKEGLRLSSDLHASAEYRAHLTQVLTEQAIARAVDRAK